jgi:hypothetical protein
MLLCYDKMKREDWRLLRRDRSTSLPVAPEILQVATRPFLDKRKKISAPRILSKLQLLPIAIINQGPKILMLDPPMNQLNLEIICVTLKEPLK